MEKRTKTEIVIKNRHDLENWIPYEDKTYIIISITENGVFHFPINQACRGVLRLQFNDIDCKPHEEQQTETYKKTYKLFTKKQAKKIIKFLNDSDKVNVVICQCRAGKSGSAGVGAAIGIILNNSDKEIFDNPLYYPNRYVYRTILNEYIKIGELK
jgi:predicted protein tyrosine phosphatase